MSAQRVVALLAVHDRPLLRLHVAGTLWLDTPEERASANLRSSLWRLHQSGCQLIEVTNRQLRLAPEVAVDAREAAALAHRLISGSPEWENLDLDSTGLTGELLPDWYEDWVLFERERLRQLFLHALETLAERLIEAGRVALALEAGLAAVGIEPLRESAHRLLIKIHLAEGNACEAVRQFQFCRRILHEQLQLAPSPQLLELVRDLMI